MAKFETGNLIAGTANVDANFDVMVSTPRVSNPVGGINGSPLHVGATRIFCENDGGDLCGYAWLDSPFITYDNNIQSGLLTPLFDYAFNGNAQDTSEWYYASTNMTASVNNTGFLVLNYGNIGTTGSGVYLQSKRYFNLTGNAGLRVGSTISITEPIVANQNLYFGLGIPSSTTSIPTDGVWFQYSSSGLIGTISSNSTITSTSPLPVVNNITIPINTVELLQIKIHDRIVYFFYNGYLLGSLVPPANQPITFMSDSLPYFCQFINSGAVSGSSFAQFNIGTVAVDQMDSNLGKSYSHIQASKGLMTYQGTQGGPMGSTALYSNSMVIGSTNTMSNTASALGTGFGGQFSWTPNLAINTDGILCSYQNPIGNINQTPRTIYITGVKIQSIVSTTLIGGPLGVNMCYSLAFGHTSVSLATPESTSFSNITTKSPRRIPLGIETFIANATIGNTSTTNSAVSMSFISPVVVNPGEYVAIAAKNIGNITVSGGITTSVSFDSYLE